MIDLLVGLRTHRRGDMLSETVCIRHSLNSPSKPDTNRAVVNYLASRVVQYFTINWTGYLVGIGNGVEIGACTYSFI